MDTQDCFNMENIGKTLKWMYVRIVLLTFLIVILFIISWKVEDKQHEEVISRINEIDSLLSRRNHLDTLYWIHLEQCAFELKDNQKPDNNN